MNSDIGWTVLV